MTETADDLALGPVAARAANTDNGGLPAGLPMPRDPRLLGDLSARQRVTHFNGRRYPFPVPNSWFGGAEPAPRQPGEVRAVQHFGKDLARERPGDGTAPR